MLFLWAVRYDRVLTDIFAVQDAITGSVPAVIEPALAEAGFAFAQHLDIWLYATLAWTEVASSGLEELQIKVSVDDKVPMAHALSFMRQLFGEWESSIGGGRVAVSLNPTSAWSIGGDEPCLRLGRLSNRRDRLQRREMRASCGLQEVVHLV
jgi:hypothetical protein